MRSRSHLIGCCYDVPCGRCDYYDLKQVKSEFLSLMRLIIS